MPLVLHHIHLAPGAQAFDAGVVLEPLGTVHWGAGPLALARAPNLYVVLPDDADAARAPRPVHAPGLAHLCVQARDGERLRAALAGVGVRPLSAPIALGTGFRYIYAHDAAGRLLEVESAPFLPTSPPAWFGHFALVSNDAEQLAAFYGALLGAGPVPGGRFRDNDRIDAVAGLTGVDVSVWWVRAAGFTLEFWQYHTPAHVGPPVDGGYAALGLESDDLDAAVAQALTAGAALEGRGDGPDGRAARLRDPDGNRLTLIQLARPGLGAGDLPHRDVLARAAAARAAV